MDNLVFAKLSMCVLQFAADELGVEVRSIDHWNFHGFPFK